MQKRVRVTIVLVVIVLSLGILAGCATRPDTKGKAYAAKPENSMSLVLYFANEQADALVKETRTIDNSIQDIELAILNELIKGPNNADARRTIPAEAKVLSVKVEDGIAFVDFSKEAVTYHWGGSAGDAMTIGSIVYSLTELPRVEKVQLLLEGIAQEAMFGHVATDVPVGR